MFSKTWVSDMPSFVVDKFITRNVSLCTVLMQHFREVAVPFHHFSPKRKSEVGEKPADADEQEEKRIKVDDENEEEAGMTRCFECLYLSHQWRSVIPCSFHQRCNSKSH